MAVLGSDYISIIKGYSSQSRDVASRALPDADIMAAVNAAQSRVLMMLNHDFFKKYTTRDVVAGHIDIPTDMLSCYQVYLYVSATDRRSLSPMVSQSLDNNPLWRNQTATYPNGYVVQFSQASGIGFVLYPQPIATITNGLRESYIPIPADITSNTSSVVASLFPHRERRLLVYGALPELLNFKDGGDDDQIAKFEALFQREVEGVRSDISKMFPNYQSYVDGIR